MANFKAVTACNKRKLKKELKGRMLHIKSTKRKITLREQFELETSGISAPSLDYMNWLEDKLEKTYQQGGNILDVASEFINDPQHLLGSSDRAAIRWFATFATERLYRDIHVTNKINNSEIIA